MALERDKVLKSCEKNRWESWRLGPEYFLLIGIVGGKSGWEKIIKEFTRATESNVFRFRGPRRC